MKYTSKKLSDTQIHVVVTADEAELKTAKDHAVKELSKKIKVQGFRQGNVPAHVAEKNIDPNTLGSETVENAINLTLNKVIAEADIRVLDQPKIELKKFVPYTTLEFEATIDILPEVTLGDYKKLKAVKKVDKVEASEIDQVLERMQLGFAEKNDVTRAAKDGDEVVIDFDGRDAKGKPVDGTKSEGYSLRLGSNTFIPGFEEKIVGHKAGEAFDIDVTFPKDYHADHLKGAKVTFAINLKKVQEVVLPKVDDAFAKKSGPFDSASELKKDIRRELEAQKDRAATDQLKDDLLGELVSKSTVPTSELLIADQLGALEQEMTQNLMYRGMSLEQYLESQGFKDRDEWRDKELRQAAERRVASGLVLAELSKAEKIEVLQEELEADLQKRKNEMSSMAEQLDTPEARRDLANRVLTEKTIERLIELNTRKAASKK